MHERPGRSGRTGPTLLIALALMASAGCTKPESRGSGRILTTEDGVLIDQFVVEDDRVVVNERGIRSQDGEPGAGSRRYILVREAVDAGQPIRLRIDNRLGGIAIQIDESLTEIAVESVVSIPGDKSRRNDDILSEVGLVLGRDSGKWLEVRTNWPEEGRLDGVSLIRVIVPRLDAVDLGTGEGRIIVAACRGDASLRTGKGSIAISLPADWTGSVRANAEGGEVSTETAPEIDVDWSSFQENRAEFNLGDVSGGGSSARLRTEQGSIRITIG